MELTIMQKAILAAIKEHNRSSEDSNGKKYLEEHNRCIKLLSMEPDRNRGGYGDTWHYEYPNKDQDDWTTCVRVDDVFMRLTVKCLFKPENKWDNNVVIYEVILYSNGKIQIYFDGTEYKRA